jgi:mRNA interferase MazF
MKVETNRTIYKKDFDTWNETKKQLEVQENLPRFFNPKEVWWCQYGVNLGFEEDGKNEFFERPVLILRKYNRELFFGLPLTTIVKDNKFHFVLTNKRLRGAVILSQGRTLSVKRLSRKMYELDAELFDEILVRHSNLLSEKPDKKSKSPRRAGKSRMAYASLYPNYSKFNAQSQAKRKELK